MTMSTTMTTNLLERHREPREGAEVVQFRDIVPRVLVYPVLARVRALARPTHVDRSVAIVMVSVTPYRSDMDMDMDMDMVSATGTIGSDPTEESAQHACGIPTCKTPKTAKTAQNHLLVSETDRHEEEFGAEPAHPGSGSSYCRLIQSSRSDRTFRRRCPRRARS